MVETVNNDYEKSCKIPQTINEIVNTAIDNFLTNQGCNSKNDKNEKIKDLLKKVIEKKLNIKLNDENKNVVNTLNNDFSWNNFEILNKNVLNISDSKVDLKEVNNVLDIFWPVMGQYMYFYFPESILANEENRELIAEFFAKYSEDNIAQNQFLKKIFGDYKAETKNGKSYIVLNKEISPEKILYYMQKYIENTNQSVGESEVLWKDLIGKEEKNERKDGKEGNDLEKQEKYWQKKFFDLIDSKFPPESAKLLKKVYQDRIVMLNNSVIKKNFEKFFDAAQYEKEVNLSKQDLNELWENLPGFIKELVKKDYIAQKKSQQKENQWEAWKEVEDIEFNLDEILSKDNERQHLIKRLQKYILELPSVSMDIFDWIYSIDKKLGWDDARLLIMLVKNDLVWDYFKQKPEEAKKIIIDFLKNKLNIYNFENDYKLFDIFIQKWSVFNIYKSKEWQHLFHLEAILRGLNDSKQITESIINYINNDNKHIFLNIKNLDSILLELISNYKGKLEEKDKNKLLNHIDNYKVLLRRNLLVVRWNLEHKQKLIVNNLIKELGFENDEEKEGIKWLIGNTLNRLKEKEITYSTPQEIANEFLFILKDEIVKSGLTKEQKKKLIEKFIVNKDKIQNLLFVMLDNVEAQEIFKIDEQYLSNFNREKKFSWSDKLLALISIKVIAQFDDQLESNDELKEGAIKWIYEIYNLHDQLHWLIDFIDKKLKYEKNLSENNRKNLENLKVKLEKINKLIKEIIYKAYTGKYDSIDDLGNNINKVWLQLHNLKDGLWKYQNNIPEEIKGKIEELVEQLGFASASKDKFVKTLLNSKSFNESIGIYKEKQKSIQKNIKNKKEQISSYINSKEFEEFYYDNLVKDIAPDIYGDWKTKQDQKEAENLIEEGLFGNWNRGKFLINTGSIESYRDNNEKTISISTQKTSDGYIWKISFWKETGEIVKANTVENLNEKLLEAYLRLNWLNNIDIRNFSTFAKYKLDIDITKPLNESDFEHIIKSFALYFINKIEKNNDIKEYFKTNYENIFKALIYNPPEWLSLLFDEFILNPDFKNKLISQGVFPKEFLEGKIDLVSLPSFSKEWVKKAFENLQDKYASKL